MYCSRGKKAVVVTEPIEEVAVEDEEMVPASSAPAVTQIARRSRLVKK